MKIKNVLLLIVALSLLLCACNDTTIIGDEPSVPSIETSGSVATKEEREACNCEELEYQIDAYDHPDLPDEMDAFPPFPLLRFCSFEEYFDERDFIDQPVNVVLATFKGIEYETNELFHVKFAVDKVYAGEIVSEEIEVRLYRGRTEIYRSEWDRLLGLNSGWQDFQSILCPYEENEQYLLILDRRSDGIYVTTNSKYTIVIPADDVKHSRMFGRWLKELTDFDLENCDNVDDFAQYVVDITSEKAELPKKS
jgi:hypothetical protein